MKKAALLVLFILISTFSWASMVSFFVVETGLSIDGAETRHSIIWENAFLDVFFDAGHIVSNAPVLRLESKPSGEILDEINFDIHDARRARVDYLIIAQLDYASQDSYPAEILFYIFNINTSENIYERRIQGRTYRTDREELDYLKTLARGFLTYVN
ncbi:MAG: hypothetical protein FWB83_09135 [Treponema sp.]|nr:hypothetical protein [Treponema sp.]MCL2181279.1 hypothetical protein [Treponema sp.]